MIENPDNHEENEETEYSEGGDRSLEQWLQKKMNELQQDLQSGDWPEGGDQLLRELGRLETSAEDLEMLSLVVNDALEGVDITRRYPTFYRRLLADPYLRQIFLDAMELLEKSEAGELEPLPEPIDVDLSFLAADEKDEAERNESEREESERKESNRPSAAERLRISLTRTRDQLRERFAPPPAAAPMRSALAGMEDDYITLLRSDISTEVGDYEVILEGRRPAASNALHLVVMLIPKQEEPPAELELEATLRWGRYQETRLLDPRGQTSFPPLPLDVILDQEGDVLSGLELRLVA